MKLEELPKTKGIKRKTKRLGKGHGTGHGKTSGRGHKGGKARSGYSVSPTFEGGQTPIARKLPMRGFNNYRFAKDWATVNLADLSRIDAVEIGKNELIDAGLIRRSSGLVKILATGDISKAVTITADAFSDAAKQKIEAAGGKAIVIEKKVETPSK